MVKTKRMSNVSGSRCISRDRVVERTNHRVPRQAPHGKLPPPGQYCHTQFCPFAFSEFDDVD